MKLFVSLTVASVMLAWGIVPPAEASSRACRNTDVVDVRGSSPFDGSIPDTSPDGLTTIAEVAVANPFNNLGELTGAVLAADPAVVMTLADPSVDLTVFAPIDEAFMAIPEETLTGIIADGALTSVLLYHVVPRLFDPRRVFWVRPVHTALGQDLYVRSGRKSPFVNNSSIECQGVRTDNGLVWLINSVLFPQFFFEE